MTEPTSTERIKNISFFSTQKQNKFWSHLLFDNSEWIDLDILLTLLTTDCQSLKVFHRKRQKKERIRWHSLSFGSVGKMQKIKLSVLAVLNGLRILSVLNVCCAYT